MVEFGQSAGFGLSGDGQASWQLQQLDIAVLMLQRQCLWVLG